MVIIIFSEQKYKRKNIENFLDSTYDFYYNVKLNYVQYLGNYIYHGSLFPMIA